MTILVIGGKGYIGSKLVEYLNTQHHLGDIDILQDVDSLQNVDKYT